VKQIKPAALGAGPTDLVTVNGVLFFAARDDMHGQELWTSNGSAAGTVLVRDINPNNIGQYPGSYPMFLTNMNGTLIFSANDVAHGAEPWILGPVPATGAPAGSLHAAIVRSGASALAVSGSTTVPGAVSGAAVTSKHQFRVLEDGTAAGPLGEEPHTEVVPGAWHGRRPPVRKPPSARVEVLLIDQLQE
jgi:ELWxxDGT repeat protein